MEQLQWKINSLSQPDFTFDMWHKARHDKLEAEAPDWHFNQKECAAGLTPLCGEALLKF